MIIPYINYVKSKDHKNVLRDYLNNKNYNYANDTLSTADSKFISSIRWNKKSLDFSIFDGNPKTRPSATDIIEQSICTEQIYNDSKIKYETKNNLGKEISRKFNDPYGNGGTNIKACKKNNNDNCDYIRADKVNNVYLTNVQDHLEEQATNAIKAINDGADSTFFLTLKALGDYMQLIEAKKRGYFFITQDTMQFLIGAYIGTKVIKCYQGHTVYYANFKVSQSTQMDLSSLDNVISIGQCMESEAAQATGTGSGTEERISAAARAAEGAAARAAEGAARAARAAAIAKERIVDASQARPTRERRAAARATRASPYTKTKKVKTRQTIKAN